MQELITSYLIQAKDCSLPGIGTFKKVNKPAFLDMANQKMFPPTEEITFSERADKIPDEMIKYISVKKHIDSSESKNQIKEWCGAIKDKLALGETVVFESIGSVQKDSAGNVVFERQKYLTLFEPVIAERVIHKEREHAVLVGDKETTSSAMNQLLNEEPVEEKDASWKVIALVLLLVALLIIFFHAFANSSSNKTGNQTAFPINEPSPTYIAK